MIYQEYWPYDYESMDDNIAVFFGNKFWLLPNYRAIPGDGTSFHFNKKWLKHRNENKSTQELHGDEI